MTEPALVAAFKVTYNGGDMTRRCVASLRRSPGVALRIVVVDKASTAGEEVAALRAEYGGDDDIELVLLDENLHFAGGVNRGGRSAPSGAGLPTDSVACRSADRRCKIVISGPDPLVSYG